MNQEKQCLTLKAGGVLTRRANAVPSNRQCQDGNWQPRSILLAQVMARLGLGLSDLAAKRKKFDRLLKR
jgi:hypothetical protein